MIFDFLIKHQKQSPNDLKVRLYSCINSINKEDIPDTFIDVFTCIPVPIHNSFKSNFPNYSAKNVLCQE